MNEKPRIQMVAKIFKSLTGLPAELRDIESIIDLPAGEEDNSQDWFDAVLDAGEWTFLIEFKSQYSSESIAAVAHRWSGLKNRRHPAPLPLLVVPYMGQSGQLLCEGEGIDWIDLSGNGRIHLPGLRVTVVGKTNQFQRRGRPRSLFAPATARIARALVLEPAGFKSQRELATYADLSESWVSRTLRRLESAGYITREGSVRLNPLERDRFLEQWRSEYNFMDHEIHRAHVPARGGDELLAIINDRLNRLPEEHAATGLGAAWLYAPHAAFRTVTFFVSVIPPEDVIADLGLRWVDSGANLWLAIPNDEGVYMGAREVNGIRCVTPIQAYLDLKEHPERSDDAAAALQAFIKEGFDD